MESPLIWQHRENYYHSLKYRRNLKDKNSISSLVILRSFDLCPENSGVVNIFFDLRLFYLGVDAHPWRRRQHLPHVPGLHYQGEIFVFLSRFYPLLIIFIKCNKFPFKSLFVQLMSMYTPFFAQLLSRRTSFPTWATTHTGGTRMVLVTSMEVDPPSWFPDFHQDGYLCLPYFLEMSWWSDLLWY